MMNAIVSRISKIENLFHAKGCSNKQIKEAESALGFSFPEEYVSYVKEYGAISFFATEWTGLNVGGQINVVNATKQERDLNPDFPSNCFVLENQGIDGIVTVANSKGEVFLVQYDNIKPLCSSISEYLEQCIDRQN